MNHNNQNFTIVTPSEVHRHDSNNISKIIKHKSGKVFRWHQDKLHTTLENTCVTPVKFSLGSSVSHQSIKYSNKNHHHSYGRCDQLSPNISSCSSSSSSNTTIIKNSNQLLENPKSNQHTQVNQTLSLTMNNNNVDKNTDRIIKPFKTRNNFKFFDYTMKKRKRTKRCDQVQPYENVISFTMATVPTFNIDSDHSGHSESLSEISKCCTDLCEPCTIPISVSTAPPTTTTTTTTIGISESTVPPKQPKPYRTSISIKELLN